MSHLLPFLSSSSQGSAPPLQALSSLSVPCPLAPIRSQRCRSLPTPLRLPDASIPYLVLVARSLSRLSVEQRCVCRWAACKLVGHLVASRVRAVGGSPCCFLAQVGQRPARTPDGEQHANASSGDEQPLVKYIATHQQSYRLPHAVPNRTFAEVEERGREKSLSGETTSSSTKHPLHETDFSIVVRFPRCQGCDFSPC
jgi:hypothetical protein